MQTGQKKVDDLKPVTVCEEDSVREKHKDWRGGKERREEKGAGLVSVSVNPAVRQWRTKHVSQLAEIKHSQPDTR